ncbi:MAG: primosomal protein N' [Bacteroidetes bacterium]|nr:primosomal protein N' [Bacteroidota bacterium]
MNNLFADVILPFALEKNYTYAVPQEFAVMLTPGMRVEVPFRNKSYTGIVAKIHNLVPAGYAPKFIIALPDHLHIVNKIQLEFWQWMAGYYMCSTGDVMNAALPAPYKLSSETIIVLHQQANIDANVLDDKEYIIAEALSIQKELTLKDIQLILQQKTIQPTIKSLIEKGIVYVKEELKEIYTPKTEKFVVLNKQYHEEKELSKLFDAMQKHEKQLNILMVYYQMAQDNHPVKKSLLLRKSGAGAGVLKTMVKNEIFIEYDEQVSRLQLYGNDQINDIVINEEQTRALIETRELLQEKSTVLIHGVTGSGKTEVYIELIKEYITAGKQVLYLLPEIALTTQIISRLKKRFGNQIGVYHSKFNQNERIEIWQKVLSNEYKIILGARSALFLPFNELGLIIIDEEHDYSYKQHEPAPRYHARDAAIYLAYLHKAKTVLGTATPCIETYFQAVNGKFGLVKMFKRYADMAMPEIQIADVKEEEKNKTMHSHFTSALVGRMKYALDAKEQIILFQNRRGYAPFLICEACGWTPRCINCDVNLVYHKFSNELRCHYCNYTSSTYNVCPACGSSRIIIKGFGTEKIDDELQYLFPDAKTGRLDLDTVKSKHGHEKILHAFELGDIDILTGTQMVTKGLDFDNVNLVGILSADQILNFSDFRAAERAFQMITQVSGRAGRKNRKGLVMIQAIAINHPVLQFVRQHDYAGFYKKEIAERQQFGYPPFTRLIRITLRHSKVETVNKTAAWLGGELKNQLGERVLGPAIPGIPRIRNKYLSEIMIKYPNNRVSGEFVKNIIKLEVEKLQLNPAHKRVEILIDVDPM